jgi:hypothetical protein
VVQALGEPDAIEGLLRPHRTLRDVRHERHVLARREARDQVVELEDEAHVLSPEARALGLSAGGEVVVAEADRSARRHVEAAEDVEQGGLAAARGTEQHHELAAQQVDVHVAQRVHLDLAHAVDLAELAGAEDRLVGARA